MKAERGYDRLAPWYRWFERIRFGGTLQQARVAMLPKLASATNVLFLGDGDGRLLTEFVQRYPNARITSVDISSRMLALQQRRVQTVFNERTTLEHPQLDWHHADVQNMELPQCSFDLVVTSFFLDCFEEDPLLTVMHKIESWIAPGAVWYTVEFRMPDHGLRQTWARFWLFVMHVFFFLTTGLRNRHLLDFTSHFETLGFQQTSSERFHFDMIESTLYQRRPS